MRPFRFACILACLAAGAGIAGPAAPPIDLRGVAVDAGSGAPVAGARAVLLTAGAADTADASGAFHIVAERVGIARPARDAAIGPPAAWNIEAYDATGRRFAGRGGDRNPTDGEAAQGRNPANPPPKAIRIGSIDGAPWYGVRADAKTEGAGAASRSNALAKTSATVDTLLVSAAGYRSARTPVTDYRTDLGEIRLEAGSGGFDIRKPSERSLACESSTKSVLDMDVVCQVEIDSLRAAVYIQSRPVACGAMTAIIYSVDKAWIETDAGIEPLAEAFYDGGGNHHNDRVTFAWKGRYYSLYHSSFGFGFRSCAPPDCMQICRDLKCASVAYDGCGRSACGTPPPLKARCSTVLPNGTVPNPVDPWNDQGGNPLAPQLPCAGDPVCR